MTHKIIWTQWVLKSFIFQNCGCVKAKLDYFIYKNNCWTVQRFIVSGHIIFLLWKVFYLFGRWRYDLYCLTVFWMTLFSPFVKRNFACFEVCFHLLSSLLTLKTKRRMWKMYHLPLLSYLRAVIFQKKRGKCPLINVKGQLWQLSGKLSTGRDQILWFEVHCVCSQPMWEKCKIKEKPPL